MPFIIPLEFNAILFCVRIHSLSTTLPHGMSYWLVLIVFKQFFGLILQMFIIIQDLDWLNHKQNLIAQ